MMSDIFIHIRRLREHHKLSQVQFASKIKINYRHYQNIEAGRVNISYVTLQKIVEQFDLTVADLCLGHYCASNPIVEAIKRDCLDFDFDDLKTYETRWRLNLPMLAIDREGTVRFANNKFVEISGYEKFEVINKPYEELAMDENERHTLRHLFNATTNKNGAEEKPRTLFSRQLKKNNTPFLAKLHYEALEKHDEPVGMLLVLCPIENARVFE